MKFTVLLDTSLLVININFSDICAGEEKIFFFILTNMATPEYKLPCHWIDTHVLYMYLDCLFYVG